MDRNQAALRVREAYGRVTLGDFDFTAGKRILRWSVGYAFTPAGILDPPRIPTNPTDRLNIREGRDLVSAEYIKGRHSLTAVYATGDLPDKVAFRYNAMIAGFDSSLIYAKDVNGRSFGGANFTRVIGEAVEVHGEYGYRAGASAAVIGAQILRCRSGVGFIGEYYWAPGPARRRYTFLNVGKSRLRNLPGWKEWDLSASMIAVSDGGVIGVFDVSRRFGNHLTAYLHAETPGGSKTSQYAMIPYAAITSFGIRVRAMKTTRPVRVLLINLCAAAVVPFLLLFLTNIRDPVEIWTLLFVLARILRTPSDFQRRSCCRRLPWGASVEAGRSCPPSRWRLRSRPRPVVWWPA